MVFLAPFAESPDLVIRIRALPSEQPPPVAPDLAPALSKLRFPTTDLHWALGQPAALGKPTTLRSYLLAYSTNRTAQHS